MGSISTRTAGKQILTRITENSSMPDVLQYLRSSFQPDNFKLGLKILTERENSLKTELESLKMANNSASKERDLEIFKIRGELKKVKRENEDLIENNSWLKREIEDLKAEKKELLEKFFELEAKVNRLVEDFTAGRYVSDDELHTENGGHEFGIQNDSPKKEGTNVVVLSDSEGELPIHTAEVLVKNEFGSCPPPNGESCGQRKRSIGYNFGDSSFCRKKLNYTKELVHEAEVAPVFHSLENTSGVGAGMTSIAGPKREVSQRTHKSTDSETNLKPIKVEEGSSQWLCESEMRLAFAGDRELCMNAVCALYRKLISAPFTLKPVDRGFEPGDEIGVELAKYFIDGHPENIPSRPMSDVSTVAFAQSKILAHRYSRKLFAIYSSGEDPLFCPNSISPKL